MPRKAASVVMEKGGRIVKSLPASEDGHGVLCKTRSGKAYVISHNTGRERLAFSLWRLADSGMEKLAVGNTPPDLYALIDWN